MARPRYLALVLLFSVPPVVPAQAVGRPSSQVVAAKSEAPPAWQTAVEARRKQLVDQNGPGTDAALRDRLLKMRDADQAARGFLVGGAPQGSPQERVARLGSVDAELTSQLKSIVAEKGWPTIALVGLDASGAAMLVLTHTADHAWQLQLLPELEQLADSGRIDPSALALVIDKQLVAAGKLQRYGSQFKFVNGRMAMYAVEDPGALDAIRARALLPPMDFYKQLLGRMYGLKPTNDIVSATPSTAAAQ